MGSKQTGHGWTVYCVNFTRASYVARMDLGTVRNPCRQSGMVCKDTFGITIPLTFVINATFSQSVKMFKVVLIKLKKDGKGSVKHKSAISVSDMQN